MSDTIASQRTSWMVLLFASLWIIPVLGGPGWSWIGFGVAAMISANARLVWPAIAYTTIGFITLALEDEIGLVDLATIIRSVAWVACILHGLIVLPGVLRRVADGTGLPTPQQQARARAQAQRELADARARALDDAGAGSSSRRRRRPAPAPRPQDVPEEARGLAEAADDTRAALVDRSAPAPAAPTVDVNKASRRELARLPGMDRESARAVVTERDRRGGFASLEDFARAAGLQPHEAVRLRAHAFCSPRPRPPRTFARRVDL